MQRPSYKKAIQWIAEMDDNEWLKEREPEKILSVTAAMICDICDVTPDKLITDLRRELARIR